MADLNYFVRRMFEYPDEAYGRYVRHTADASLDANLQIRYMEVQINKDSFEVPLMLVKSFVNIVGEGKDAETEAITAVLNDIGYYVDYKTSERCFKDVIQQNFPSSRLVRMQFQQKNEFLTYYGTRGAVFDKDFNPLMICTWEVKRTVNERSDGSTVFEYELVRPVMHIVNWVFVDKKGLMEKFISNKLTTMLVNEALTPPSRYSLTSRVKSSPLRPGPARIVIDSFPFNFRDVAVPSISTTNEKLLQTAIDHLDEIVQ